MGIRANLIGSLVFFTYCNCWGQLFKQFPLDSIGAKPYELYTTKEGAIHLTSSIGMWKLKGHMFEGPAAGTNVLYDEKGNPSPQNVRIRNYLAEDSIRSMAQGPDGTFYFVAHDNFFLFRPNGEVGGWGWPPFNFPRTSPILKIWIDDKGDIYAGTRHDNFYIIEGGGKRDSSWKGIDFGPDKDSNYIVTKGGKKVRQVIIQPGIGVYSFAQDATDNNLVWVGTNRGLFTYNKQTGECRPLEGVNKSNVTVTEIYTNENGNVWFSTLEKGMGVYNLAHRVCQFYAYKKVNANIATQFPVKTFCYKSPHQFFLAISDSLPAIFNTVSRTYQFIGDSIFHETPNRTTDIKVDRLGNLVLIKGGRFYIWSASNNDLLRSAVILDSSLLAPFFRGIQLWSGHKIATLDYHPELLKKVVLKHNQNDLLVFYDVHDFHDKSEIHFAWKIDGYTKGWVEMPTYMMDSTQVAVLQSLKPGNYLLQVKVRTGDEDWRKQLAEMTIIITAPYWQTGWFWLLILTGVGLITFAMVKWRVNAARKQERIKMQFEKEALELEAKALRAQMNPHFIFNCMNSIKCLIQTKEEDKAVNYLTTLSKLLRIILHNCDKREITLFDEIETCRLYTELESMRFGKKLRYLFEIEEGMDLKSIMVPALIIQPFIENAIWHGLMPKHEGGILNVTVQKKTNKIYCIISDNGIGRETSKQNKFKGEFSVHQSVGMHLTQARLDLDNVLNERAAILEIIDEKDGGGKASGTTVILQFKQE